MKQKMTVLLALFLGAAAFAEVKTDPVFSSNMVLQQEKPIAFFGTADKGAIVKVEFAGKSVSAKTADNGKWKAVFPAMKAGNAVYSAKISDGKKSLSLTNLVIGDVWICAGQSNMEMPVGTKFRRGWSAQNCEEEVRNANYPLIRCADQQNRISHLVVRKDAKMNADSWLVCSPKTAGNFSATAYFFARQLHKDTNLPIGLINLTWSGTCIQPWISLEGYKNAKLEGDLAQIARFTMTPEQQKAFEKQEEARYYREIGEYRKKMDDLCAKERNACAAYAKADFDDGKWQKATAHTHWMTTVRWYRTSFELPSELKGKEVLLSSSNMVMARGFELYLNGKKIQEADSSRPDNEQKISVKIKASDWNQSGKNVLAVRAFYFYGNGDRQRQGNMFRFVQLSAGGKKKVLNVWKEKDEILFDYRKAKLRLPGSINYPYRSPQFFCNLYNGMVDAWTTLPVKGVIWYQGCSNAGQLHYLPLHKALIADWRNKWQTPAMPFLVVQLAAFGDGNWTKSKPSDAAYALTRDIQMQLTKDPNVGLACTIDIGEATNIHPANKQEVGRRLALEAERIAYGKNVISRGPVFDRAKVEGSTIRVFFRGAEKGLKTCDGKKPGAFAIAGADKKFVWADAKIDGSTVVVSSPAVKTPKYVRYAYVSYRGDCNLHGMDSLPVYPFRSDAMDYSKVK